MRGEYETAAPFIGFAYILDRARRPHRAAHGYDSEFGVEFDSMADIISFGMAPAILSFQWGLSTLGRLGWAAGFLFVAAAAIRLARFNIQSAAGGDKRYFVGMPSPAASRESSPPPCLRIRIRSTITVPRCRRWRWSSCRRC